jgi:hypothetical protein
LLKFLTTTDGIGCEDVRETPDVSDRSRATTPTPNWSDHFGEARID